jgi:hypothetical protein
MKIAIGLISAIFGILLVIYGIIEKATYFIRLTSGEWKGMMFIGQPNYWAVFLVGVILIIVGCFIYERGIKEK